jgi:1-acyl-sn-glycerol-3-phosphate acyltransferase
VNRSTFGARPARWWRLGGSQDPPPPHTGTKGMDRGRRIAILLCGSLYRIRVARIERIPASGPVVFVANHQNFMDGGVLFGLLTRRVSFLIKAEAVQGALGWLLTNVGQYALHRDVPDREPLLQALAQLNRGGAIGVFPEGTRGAGTVSTVHPGAAWLAVRSGATVVPVALRGTARPEGRQRRRFRPYVHTLIGEPFPIEHGAGKKAVTAATGEIQRRLSALVIELDSAVAAAGGRSALDSRPASS